MKFTTVLGVDGHHLKQLALTWPTWIRHKPMLLDHPLLVFFDREQVSPNDIREVIEHDDWLCVPWPVKGVKYEGDPGDKWTDPQRCKMLSGFIHVASSFVETEYWLKIDTDVVATGCNDWMDESWFLNNPAIISHKWTFTKPANQMELLDHWVWNNENNLPELRVRAPLQLHPKEGSDRLGHRRIISFAGLFNTGFTEQVAKMCNDTCGPFKMPVPSQDGLMWYCATRLGWGIERVSMKSLGFQQWHNYRNIERNAKEAMNVPMAQA